MEFNSYKPLRLIELFAGIGAQAKALTNLGIEYEHWCVCEWDKYAIQSYNAVHGTNFNTSDITKLTAKDLNIIDTEHYNYLVTYSFPCQDLSNAGKGRGMEKGSGTRSGLLWEVERLLSECTELPQVLLMENVPQVHGKKNVEHFEKWIEFLESKGYTNVWADLNAKDYGMPQNRNRTYMISILGEYTYEFPKPIPLELTLKDFLEKEVDEKYYLSEKKLNTINKWNSLERPLEKVYGKNSIARTLTTRSGAECGSLATYSEQFEETTNIVPLLEKKSELKSKLCNELLEKGLVEEGDVIRHSYTNNRLNNGVENMARTESKEKLSPTLDTRCDCLGVVVKEDTLKREVCNKLLQEEKVVPYDIVDVSYAQSRLDELLDGKVSIKNSQNNQIANTITTAANSFGVCVPKVVGSVEKTEKLLDEVRDGKYPPTTAFGKYLFQSSRFEDKPLEECSPTIKATKVDCGVITNYRIRKLTPKECWLLMGFDSTDVEKAAKVCSNSQLYKQAGNSIVVNVLMAIFKELFVPKKSRSQWLDELLGGV